MTRRPSVYCHSLPCAPATRARSTTSQKNQIGSTTVVSDARLRQDGLYIPFYTSVLSGSHAVIVIIASVSLVRSEPSQRFGDFSDKWIRCDRQARKFQNGPV